MKITYLAVHETEQNCNNQSLKLNENQKEIIKLEHAYTIVSIALKLLNEIITLRFIIYNTEEIKTILHIYTSTFGVLLDSQHYAFNCNFILYKKKQKIK